MIRGIVGSDFLVRVRRSRLRLEFAVGRNDKIARILLQLDRASLPRYI
jgi:hypothetical protein